MSKARVLSPQIRARNAATADAKRLRTENAAMREALAPFAEAASELMETLSDDVSLWQLFTNSGPQPPGIRVGDIRRAAKAYATHDKEHAQAPGTKGKN